MSAEVLAIEYYLPEGVLTSEALAREYPEWSISKIEAKTGISARHIAAKNETSGDLAFYAATRLFGSGACTPESIDFLLLCTQSPDYFLPTTACLLQHRLGLRTSVGALDFNLGCSGYIYGLGLAKGLIETGQAERVLLITAETYSKFIHPRDKSVRTIFGDAAAATLVASSGGDLAAIGPFLYGTDGSGGGNLIVPTGGLRRERTPETSVDATDAAGNVRSADNLFMDGAEIFSFTLDSVPKAVDGVLRKAGLGLDEIDLVVMHQANAHMLEHLRKKLAIPTGKFFVALRLFGNTVSSTIPIALVEAAREGVLKPGGRVLLVGFGVGYSWGATLIRWHGDAARRGVVRENT